MNPNDVAPMVMAITLFLVVGGVILLRPITKRLGSLLEAITQQKSEAAASNDVSEMRQYVSNLESRLTLLEERQNFAEALLASGDRRPEPVRVERPSAPEAERTSRSPSG